MCVLSGKVISSELAIVFHMETKLSVSVVRYRDVPHCSTHHEPIIRHSKTDPRVVWSSGRDDECNTVVWLHGIAGCVARSISGNATAEITKYSTAGQRTYTRSNSFNNHVHVCSNIMYNRSEPLRTYTYLTYMQEHLIQKLHTYIHKCKHTHTHTHARAHAHTT